MSTTLQISPTRWRAFFDSLTDLYSGWRLTIEVLDRELGDQILEDGLLLQGFSFDSRRPDADLIIEGGDPLEPLLVHYVRRPRSVWMADTELGAETDIQVESEDHTFTLVRLRRLLALPPAESSRKQKPASRAKGKAVKVRRQPAKAPQKKKPNPRGASRR